MLGHTASNTLQFLKNETNSSSNALSFAGGHNASGTYNFNAAATTLTWTINSKYYAVNGNNPSGSISVTISGTSATATFSTTLYNLSDMNDSVKITNGSYTGAYTSTY